MVSHFKILPYYTYDEWVRWEGRWELIEGIPYAMRPSAEPKHQLVTGNIASEFKGALKHCSNCKVYLPIDYFQPDILVVCREINKDFLDFPPALVVEVLSPSTALKDRHTKFELYQSQGVKYYLIVSPDTEEVEVYAIENGIYELKSKGRDFSHRFTFEDDCITDIDFKEIW
jgi:Uma2 family endonuclease